ncbi:hypothetical protein MNBD_GAMMA05-1213 [hydrothermal vent metagenome]|uniref:PEP-CTERM protein-sorting domain-containing protein n=1 Tax=hydrothermal vent metagenome TaxID=652676 RepID=A0A3B0WMF9_9ZZZZ
MKNIIKGFGIVLALVASSAYAVPTLFFDGEISFRGGLLNIDSVLTATQDVAPAPELVGSSFDFTALLTGVDTSSSFLTIGNFGTTGGTDLSVTDGNSIELLTGNFESLQMKGGNGSGSGLVKGVINSTGGTLEDMFGIGNLIAFEFNLSTTFSAEMFDSLFTGDIDGRVIGEEKIDVPEPTPLALLALGLMLVGFIKHSRANQSI